MRTRVWYTLMFVVLMSASSVAEQDPGPQPIGAGGFPLTPAHASAWFAHRADDDSKVLTLMIYLEGSPGWHGKPTDFEWQVNSDPATIDMTVGDTEIHAKYSPSRSRVELFGSAFKLTDHNVFLVRDIDGPEPTVYGLGVHDLTFASADNPATVLVARDSKLRYTLAGTEEPEDSNGDPEVSAEILAWDHEGLQLTRTGNPEDDAKACALFRQAADKGYADSQYRLGFCYEAGRGVAQDLAAANDWYKKAARQGHVDALYKLGHSYRVGRGTEIDLHAALDWYKKAADIGDVDAIHNVGWMYATGQGVEANIATALEWYVKAAEKGEPASQFELARRYLTGDGVPTDKREGYAWFLVVEAQRSSLAPQDWDMLQELGSDVELSSEALAGVRKLAGERLREISRQKILRLAN